MYQRSPKSKTTHANIFVRDDQGNVSLRRRRRRGTGGPFPSPFPAGRTGPPSLLAGKGAEEAGSSAGLGPPARSPGEPGVNLARRDPTRPEGLDLMLLVLFGACAVKWKQTNFSPLFAPFAPDCSSFTLLYSPLLSPSSPGPRGRGMGGQWGGDVGSRDLPVCPQGGRAGEGGRGGRADSPAALWPRHLRGDT